MQLSSRLGVFSPGILRSPHLRRFLDGAELVARPDLARRPVDAVIGWGHKPTADRARAFAAREGLPYLALEDGFLRSVLLGVTGEPPLSIVVDELGVHYDRDRSLAPGANHRRARRARRLLPIPRR
ncbi:MAG: hypothetical protein KF901_16095, partial [Myxococcales bacterium]|nr:hypothetical protein [Myxococcales bacterium]